jgi:hypothetical protein
LMAMMLVVASCGGAGSGSSRAETTSESAADVSPAEVGDDNGEGGSGPGTDDEVDSALGQLLTECPEASEMEQFMRLSLEAEHAREDPDDGLDCAYRTDPSDPFGVSVKLSVITLEQAMAMIDNLIEQGIIESGDIDLNTDADEGMAWAEANIADGCGPDGTTCDYDGVYDRAVRVDHHTWYTVYGSSAFQSDDGPFRFAIIDAFAMVEGSQCHVLYSITKDGTELDIEGHALGPVAVAQHACGLG